MSLPVAKTYKLYLGGSFVRSESGRYDPATDAKGRHLANVCRASRKDIRDAVVKARAAVEKWSGSTPYLRGQILYRMAEMLEGKRREFVEAIEALSEGPKGRRHGSAKAQRGRKTVRAHDFMAPM